jgi:hypothetical protein
MVVNVPRWLTSLDRMNALAPWAGQLARALLREPLPAAGRASKASPPERAAWHLYSARTPTSWKPPPGCTTSARHPVLP